MAVWTERGLPGPCRFSIATRYASTSDPGSESWARNTSGSACSRSSASMERIHSPRACPSAALRAWANESSHVPSMTRAPAARAIGTVRSFEPVS